MQMITGSILSTFRNFCKGDVNILHHSFTYHRYLCLTLREVILLDLRCWEARSGHCTCLIFQCLQETKYCISLIDMAWLGSHLSNQPRAEHLFNSAYAPSIWPFMSLLLLELIPQPFHCLWIHIICQIGTSLLESSISEWFGKHVLQLKSFSNTFSWSPMSLFLTWNRKHINTTSKLEVFPPHQLNSIWVLF